MPELIAITHANFKAGQFYSISDNAGAMALCCPASGCSWEKEITAQDDLDEQLSLAEEHVIETRNLLTS